MCVIIGVFAMWFAIYNTSIFKTMVHLSMLVDPFCTIPLFLIVMRLEVQPLFFAINLVISGITVFVLNYFIFFDELGTYCLILLVCISTFLLCNIFTYGKLKTQDVEENKKDERPKRSYYESITSPVVDSDKPYISRLMKRIRESMSPHNDDPILFGAVTALLLMVPIFMWEFSSPHNYPELIGLRMFSAILCVGLMLKNYWHPAWQKHYTLYWYISIGFCMPFVTSYMYMQEQTTFWAINWSIAMC